jgi:ABC-2 type transport system ATP-binding protein
MLGLRGRALIVEAAELLDRFGLTGAADRPVATYSEGMRRSLSVALGVVHGPQVLFLDEPGAGLDPWERAELWDRIGELAWDRGLTVLLATRCAEEADRLARNVAIVDRGRIVKQGAAKELKADLHRDSTGLSVPELACPREPRISRRP